MELKYYDKQWLPALKGIFLILFGIIAILQIFGTIVSLAVMFAFLIGIIGVILILYGIRYKSVSHKTWTIGSGIIHLAFFGFLMFQVDRGLNVTQARTLIANVILIWILFYGLSEVVEAVLLFIQKNAFSVLFVMNALLSLLFGFFLNIALSDLTLQRVSYLGLLALVFGLVNVLSSYLLSRIKE